MSLKWKKRRRRRRRRKKNWKGDCAITLGPIRAATASVYWLAFSERVHGVFYIHIYIYIYTHRAASACIHIYLSLFLSLYSVYSEEAMGTSITSHIDRSTSDPYPSEVVARRIFHPLIYPHLAPPQVAHNTSSFSNAHSHFIFSSLFFSVDVVLSPHVAHGFSRVKHT